MSDLYKKLWAISGDEYHRYSQKYPQYKLTNKRLVELADIKEDQTVVDLACGTGMTTIEILKRNPRKVYAVDFTKGMIEIARKNIPSEKVTFINDDAKNLKFRISEKVDSVLCNAGFWQFSDPQGVLSGIKELLKDSGLFIFNIPRQFIDTKESENSSAVITGLIKEELDKRGYDTFRKLKNKVGFDDITALIDNSGMKLEKTEVLEFDRDLMDYLDFFKIQGVVPFFDGVPEAEQKSILEDIKNRLLQQGITSLKSYWTYCLVRKR